MKSKSYAPSASFVRSAAALATSLSKVVSHYKGATPAKKTKSATSKTFTKNTKKQSLTHHSSTAQPAITFRHGRSSNLNKKFVQKVRSALTSKNSQNFISTQCKTSGIGDCTYSQSPVILGPDHVSVIAGNMGSSNYTKKFTIQNVLMNCSLTNQSSGVMCLRVYECMYRTDCPYSATYPSPLSLLGVGFTDAGLTTNITNIAGTAYQSPAFCSWIKIINVRQVELNAGETKHISIRNNNSKFVNLEKYAVGGAGYSIQGFGRYSKFLLFQQWGQTVNDSVSTTVVSTDRTKLDFVFTVKYEYTWLDDYTNNVYTSGSLGAVNTAQYVNETTGSVVTDTQA